MAQQGQGHGQLAPGPAAVGGHGLVHVGFQVEASHQVPSHLEERGSLWAHPHSPVPHRSHQDMDGGWPWTEEASPPTRH